MKLGEVPRLLRVQFTPIMAAPVLLGGAAALHYAGRLSPAYLLLALVGAVLLHLAANGVDDAYDFVNGTDAVAEKMFPPDAPGWKPIPRGLFSVNEAFALSYLLYGASLLIGVFLSLLVGWFALAIAVPGILLSYFYTAPPLKLDYQGLGLGELSILLSFGPIPALGAYFVSSGIVSLVPVFLAVPSGVLTTVILISHDQIYYDVYRESGKKSLTVVIGRRRAALLATSLSLAAYAALLLFVLSGFAPVTCLIALAALPLLAKVWNTGSRDLSPPEYGSKTMAAFVQSTLFTVLVALGLILG